MHKTGSGKGGATANGKCDAWQRREFEMEDMEARGAAEEVWGRSDRLHVE